MTRPVVNWSKWLVIGSLFAAAVQHGGRGVIAAYATQTPARNRGAGSRPKVDDYGKLPLSFEENRGQTDSRVKFLAHAGPATVFLLSREIVLSADQSAAVRMRFVGANAASSVVGAGALRGQANYFIGNDPKSWHTHVPTYAKVQYRQLYRGVDLVVYGDRQRLEYDLIAAPGADLASMRLRFEGVERLAIAATGDLVVHTANGDLRHRKPIIYQDVDGVRRPVDGSYVIKGKREVGIRLAAYDKTKPLTIDPILSYSTYLGGSVTNIGLAIAVGRDGNAYVSGLTNSSDFPPVNPLQPKIGGSYDIFIAKLNPAGTALLYSTYFGGSASEQGTTTGEAKGIAVDRDGNVLVTGGTGSANFPVKNAYQPLLSGLQDAFVAKIDATGAALVYSTFLGGANIEDGTGIAADRAGNAYVTGHTFSSKAFGLQDFPTTPGAYQRLCGEDPVNGVACGVDAFVTKFDPDGALVYSTRLGGDGDDRAEAIAVDSTGAAYVTGQTLSQNGFPANGFQQHLASPDGTDAFVAKLSPGADHLQYFTYLGGKNPEAGFGGPADTGRAIALDLSGSAYVTGQTLSTDFPVKAGAPFDPTDPFSQGFFAILDATGTSLIYSTYLSCIPAAVAVDRQGNASIAGSIPSPSAPFPLVNPVQAEIKGPDGDACVVTINPAAPSPRLFSSYLGGTLQDDGFAVAVDRDGSIYVTGQTQSPDFPTVQPIQPFGNPGALYAFVAKISGAVQLPPLGDANCDGSVTAADLTALVLSISNGLPAACSTADPNDDGVLDQDDLLAMSEALFDTGP